MTREHQPLLTGSEAAEHKKLMKRIPIHVEDDEVTAERFHANIKFRFYRTLVLATNVKSKLEILNSSDFHDFIESALNKISSDNGLQSVINYFQKVYDQSHALFITKIHLTKYIPNADQALKDGGYYTPETQCSALMWTNQKELMERVSPAFPKIAAVRETLLRLAALTIAETCINYVINLIDSWDGSADYPDVQKFLVPFMYVLTVVLLLGKGVFDYRATRNSLHQLQLEINQDEADKSKFDRDIAARVIMLADKIQAERELRGPQLA